MAMSVLLSMGEHVSWDLGRTAGTRAQSGVARADQGSVKSIAYFYVGNGKGVAYVLKTHPANSNSL